MKDDDGDDKQSSAIRKGWRKERRFSDELHAEVRKWLANNWNPNVDRGSWAHVVVDAGSATPSWEPEFYGRGLTDSQSRLVAAEFADVGAHGCGHDRGNLFACTLHDAGTEEQKQRLIPPSIRGESKWCLLYSEPGAGSDLAGLRTRARGTATSG